MENIQKLRVAAKEIRDAFNKGLYLKDRTYYRKLGPRFGKLAYDVFIGHIPFVDEVYVEWRQKSCGHSPLELEFWEDEQAVLVLYESLEKEGKYACA